MATDRVIISLGNDILGDDGIALSIGDILSEKTGIVNKKTNSFGFEIIEAVSGYKKIFFVDAVVIPDEKIGQVFTFDIEDFNKHLHLSSPHTFNLPTALKLLELYGQKPELIKIYGINIPNELKFSETFSEELKKEIPEIVKYIFEDIKKAIDNY